MESVQPTDAAAAAAARTASRDERPAATRTIEGIADEFRRHAYIAERSLATTVFLALELGRPLLLEGEAGVGKTELAKVLAKTLDTRLIRLQCYEGLDVNTAVYEWNYPRQMLEIRLLEARGEIDRADEEFEAYLLEILSDFQVTVPEIGTIRASRAPRVVLTSNRTRDLHDALKRRCLYHWIDYPPPEREVEIVRRRVPTSSRALAEDVVAALARMRAADVQKPPGIAEGIDWVAALELLGAERLDADAAGRTLGAVLKYREDQEAVRAAGLERLVRGAA